MPDLLFTRRAILDPSLRVSGYVVEYAPLSATGRRGPNQAVELLGGLVDIGIQELAGQHKLYLTCSPLEAEPLVEMCAASHQLGLYLVYSRDNREEALHVTQLCSDSSIAVALDAGNPVDLPPELLVTAEMAFIHADRALEQEVADWAHRLGSFRARAGIARITSDEQYQVGREAGCERFYGTFLEKPSRWASREIPGGLLSPLRLLAKLQDPDTTTSEIEQLVRADAALSYRVLRWVNSAYYGIGIEIDHIGHAIVYLGLDRLKNLLSVLALTQLRPASPELLTISAIRARMAELLAPRFAVIPFRAFTMGLFSMVDAIAQAPFEQVLADVSLHDDIKTALLTGSGPYGNLLRIVLDYEKGNWQAVQQLKEPEQLAAIYRDALKWANGHGLSNG